jgi:hypothetical protein
MNGVRRLCAGYRSRFRLIGLACWMLALPSHAIEIQPTDEQIHSTVERGKAAARQRLSPDQLHTSFGSKEDLAPRGFIMTKLGSLLVMANHLALRDLSPTEQDITQILANDLLLVNVVIYGDRVNFAADSYVVMEQAGRTVKPASVRFDARGDRTVVWPQQPAYRAKIIAQFPYADLDMRAPTTLTVFPSSGGQVSFDLDFARIE